MSDVEGAVLIVGGYGVVGEQVSRFVRRRHPKLPLIIAGRNPVRAEALARELTLAETASIDIEKPDPLKQFEGRLRAVVEVVNDPYDYLLLDSVRAGIPLVDITRWTARMREALSLLSGESLQAPVMLASSWMAGLAAVVSVAAARRLKRADSIHISILFSLSDKSGDNSIEYMDRLGVPFEVMIDGRKQVVHPVTDPRMVTFPGGFRTKAYRFDSPEQMTLPEITGAGTVASRIAFDSNLVNKALVVLVRSGFWKLIERDRFAKLRRSILHNPGEGGNHEIVIEIAGADESGNPRFARASILEGESQSRLTALGVTMHLERVLGLDGAPPPGPIILYPESEPQLESGLQLLRDFGVSVEID